MYTKFRGIHATTADAVIGGIAATVALACLAALGWTLNQGGWHVLPERTATICQLIQAGDVYMLHTADGQQYLLEEEVRVNNEPVSAQRAFDGLEVGTSYRLKVRMIPGFNWNTSVFSIGEVESPSEPDQCPS